VCCTLLRCEGVGVKVTGIQFMTVFIMRRDSACFLAWVYKDTAALSPWERHILYPFRLIAISQLFCLIRVEEAKLVQAGFGDFLADARVIRLKGKCDDNKEVFCLTQFDMCRTQID